MPFRGAYLRLRPERASWCAALIYPVPDPALPFLGVHLTRHIDGEVSLGPSALLWPRAAAAIARLARAPGGWRGAGGAPALRAAPRRQPARASPREAAQLRAGARAGRLRRWFAGVRAQALGRDGRLVDDFVFSETERALHVRNAPSPAATSSLAIARLIADRARRASSASLARRAAASRHGSTGRC